MNDKKHIFPDFFPDNCPPEGAQCNEVDVYRLCKHVDRVTHDDFKSYYEINPRKYNGNILAYGVSVLKNKSDCEKLLKLPANKKKFKSISKGKTYTYMGVIKETPNNKLKSHCTWWLYEGSKPKNVFSIV